MLSSLALLPNGLLASGSHDFTVKIWSPQNGSLMFTLNNHTNYVYALNVLNGGYLARGSKDGTVKIWG